MNKNSKTSIGQNDIHNANLVSAFFKNAVSQAERPLLFHKKKGKWTGATWSEVAESIKRLSGALVAAGVQPRDRIMICAENRPEWAIADLAIMAAGCITVPTYTTNTRRDHAHILDNSGARAVFVSNEKLLDQPLQRLGSASAPRSLE